MCNVTNQSIRRTNMNELRAAKAPEPEPHRGATEAGSTNRRFRLQEM
jgi:hypothetical protein